ncbi:MAG: hypothetical protein ABT19_03005 [Rhodanobacter sp. SCN 68-63]|nr:MAG: hypothetical protein ABT19_03005 [Rhodanobacter sp. SCN 68-63]
MRQLGRVCFIWAANQSIACSIGQPHHPIPLGCFRNFSNGLHQIQTSLPRLLLSPGDLPAAPTGIGLTRLFVSGIFQATLELGNDIDEGDPAHLAPVADLDHVEFP